MNPYVTLLSRLIFLAIISSIVVSWLMWKGTHSVIMVGYGLGVIVFFVVVIPLIFAFKK